MADPPRYSDTGRVPARESTTGLTRWFRVAGIALIIVLLLIAVMRLIGGGGEHGPGRHTSAGVAAPATPTTGHMPRDGGHR